MLAHCSRNIPLMKFVILRRRQGHCLVIVNCHTVVSFLMLLLFIFAVHCFFTKNYFVLVSNLYLRSTASRRQSHRVPVLASMLSPVRNSVIIQCIDAVGWTTGMASGL